MTERGTYTADWFTQHSPTWRWCLPPHLGPAPARWLEVGSYEGRSALWALDNLLPAGSTVSCVDHFDGDYERRFDANVVDEPRILKFKGKARDVLPRLAPGFAGAYVDGAHEEEEVAHDARAVWRLVRAGGVVVFDDAGMASVARAVGAFLVEVPGARILYREWQVIVVKAG